ncbi:MAG: nucleoside recognition domain-containing protein, partial [Atopobiaceae bacterium]|nr:nucleoside recognition domain-containing protein [Atopobiaceae bacterium]
AFSGGHGQLAAFAFMIFNLLCAPCFAAMGAIKREMNNGKWTAFAIGYMCLFAYCTGMTVYQIGLAVAGAVNPVGLVAAVAVLGFAAYMLFIKKYQEADRLTME